MRQHERHGERLALARHAGEDADRGKRGVDREHPDERAQLQLRRRAEGKPDAQPGEAGVEERLRSEGEGQDGPVLEADVRGPEHGHDQRRPDRVPGVREDEHRACRVDVATQIATATARSADRPRRAAAPAPAAPG